MTNTTTFHKICDLYKNTKNSVYRACADRPMKVAGVMVLGIVLELHVLDLINSTQSQFLYIDWNNKPGVNIGFEDKYSTKRMNERLHEFKKKEFGFLIYDSIDSKIKDTSFADSNYIKK